MGKSKSTRFDSTSSDDSKRKKKVPLHNDLHRVNPATKVALVKVALMYDPLIRKISHIPNGVDLGNQRMTRSAVKRDVGKSACGKTVVTPDTSNNDAQSNQTNEEKSSSSIGLGNQRMTRSAVKRDVGEKTVVMQPNNDAQANRTNEEKSIPSIDTKNRNLKSSSKSKSQIVRVHKFKEREIVWAKMRGFPLWPAKIESFIQGTNMVNVIFYGDKTTAKMNISTLVTFNHGCATFVRGNRQLLNKAVNEALIEKAEKAGLY